MPRASFEKWAVRLAPTMRAAGILLETSCLIALHAFGLLAGLRQLRDVACSAPA